MIRISHINKSYGSRRVLDDVSFTFEPGKITGLVGVNGSGKTTIMKAIMCLTKLQSGSITLDDHAITGADFERLIYVTDEIVVIKSMKIEEALDFMAAFYANYSSKRAYELLELFRLNPEDSISSLSKGNVAKVNMLLGLSVDADYYLMDEPFSGIDIFSREIISRVFATDLLADKAVLISSHDVKELDLLLDQVVLLDEGRVVAQMDSEAYRAQGKSLEDLMREVYEYD